MSYLNNVVSTIKKHKAESSMLFLTTLTLLFLLTSVLIMKLILNQIDQSSSVQLFTSNELSEIQTFYSFWFIVFILLGSLLLLIIFSIKLLKSHQKKMDMKLSIYTTGIELIFCILAAALALTTLFALFEPFYEKILQNIYQYGLAQFHDLPTYVLSNGSSGIAYSIDNSLSYSLSSVTLLSLFFKSLGKTVGILLLFLFLLISVYSFINYQRKKIKIR